MKKLSLIMMAAMLAQPAFAEEDREEAACKPEETASVYTTHVFNNYTMDVAQQRFEADKKKIQELAGDQGVTLRLTSESYSANPANYDVSDRRDMFSVNSSLNFEVKPTAKGKDFFRALTNAGINASYSYSKTDNCPQD